MTLEELIKTHETLKASITPKKPTAIWLSSIDYNKAKSYDEVEKTDVWGTECLKYEGIFIFESEKMKEGYYHPLYAPDFNVMAPISDFTDESLTEAIKPYYFTETFFKVKLF